MSKPQQSIDADAIRAEAESFLNDGAVIDDQASSQAPNLFVVKKANQWIDEAKQRPIPQRLFDDFWFENELCILFADTGQGKSVLAVQIGEAIASGKPIDPFSLTATPKNVLYFDFELSDKQFENRYSKEVISLNGAAFSHYQFSDRFFRAEIDPNGDVPDHFKSFEDYLNFSLAQSVVDFNAEILIVDNITYLRNETERAKDALPLMKHLKALKQKYNLSILALAHTPKRDMSKSITRNDLQGSKMLINFCDSSFAIGESAKDKHLRYLKQIKVRNVAFSYDDDNVRVCQLDKPDDFLKFEWLSDGRESEHLKIYTDKDKDDLIQQAKDLYAQGKTQQEIADTFGVSKMTISRYLKKP